MTETELNQLKELLAIPKRVAITTHRTPDGDAIGSSLAMCHYLKAKGHEAQVVTPNSYAEFLQWLPGNDKVIEFESCKEKALKALNEAELIFCLDFNSLYRMEEMEGALKGANAKIILLDHHPNPDGFADFTLSDTSASSTAEIIFLFIEMLGDTALISPEAAQCLYTGMMTDTGSFSYPSTSARTHRIAARLIGKGADVEEAQTNVYRTFSEERLKLLGYCLSKKLQVFSEYRTALISLSLKELNRFNFRVGDTEDLVNYGLSIKGVRLAALVLERRKEVKLSFRSKGSFPVNELAKKHFNGGGHRNAAGGNSELSLEETVEKFIGLLPQYKNELGS